MLLSTLRRARAIAAIAGVLAVALPWACFPRGSSGRRRLAEVAWLLLLRGFGIRLRCHGERLPESGTLFVANHISWTDIAVLGRAIDAGFVAKSEVRGWPVLGPLACGYGCLFVERSARARVRHQADAIDGHLSARRGIVLFPEGTTGDGSELLPFRSSLFAACDGRPGVQPVTVLYRRRDGSALSAGELRRVAWTGDDALLPHALALAAFGGLVVDVVFEEPVCAADRKQLARLCRERIAARLAVRPRR